MSLNNKNNKCPVCYSNKCTYTEGVWFWIECSNCGFEYSGSSGILLKDIINKIKKEHNDKKN